MPSRCFAALVCFLHVYFGCAAKDDFSLQAQSVDIGNGHQVWIFDKVLTYDELQALHEYVGFIPKAQFMQRDIDKAVELGVTPFHALVTKSEMVGLISKMKSLLDAAIGQQSYFVNMFGEFLHSLDPKPPVKDDCQNDTYYMTVFLNEIWMHNSYGQISFYSDANNSGRLEIVHTVHPKPARVVVWPSCVTHVMHPPAVNYFSNLRMLRLKFSTKQTQNLDQPPVEANKVNPFGEFKFINEDANRTIDHKKHLKKSFFDSKRRGIFVFDDLFTTEELRQLRNHILDTGSPHLSQYDGSALEDHDNVQWIAGFNVTEFIKTQMWDRVRDLLVYLTRERKWFPYDVALNYIRHADHTRIHPDAEPHQYEYTYLLYLTENLTQSDFGETVFFEQERKKSDGVHQFTNPGGEEFEPIAAVWPKFGRVAIFRNVIQHSARPLSSYHLDCRFTFAVKVARSERLAYVKQLYEALESVGELTKKQQKLNRELSSGYHDDPKRSPLSLEELKRKMEEAAMANKDFVDMNKSMFLEMMN